uniref:Uncharacterized protein n=1 Tax=Rhizophora mucronata TaxID=61149 RepID=A0A2P2QUF3_RHIMU
MGLECVETNQSQLTPLFLILERCLARPLNYTKLLWFSAPFGSCFLFVWFVFWTKRNTSM